MHGDDLRSLLRFDVNSGIASATWQPAGVTARYPLEGEAYDDWVTLEDVSVHTASFKLHGKFGYTIDNYTEFFVLPEYGNSADTGVAYVESVEITLGEVTPLGYHLFAGEFDESYHADWSYVLSLRILGAPAEQAESLLLTGLGLFEMEANVRLDLMSFEIPDAIDVDWQESPDARHHDLRLPRPVSDIEPLRLFQRGLSESQSTSAFLHFYRVLEFYSIIQLQDSVSGLRWDRDLTAKEFLKRVAGVIDRDERNLLGMLLSKLADSGVLNAAKSKGLIEAASVEALCSAIYSFRNSVVHAKYDQRASITVESPFEINDAAKEWSLLCKRLAWNAMKTVGSRVG